MDNNVINMDERRPSDLDWKKYTRFGVGILIFIIIFGLIIGNAYIAQEGEYKVVRQFGEVVDVKENPGIYFKIPFIQTVETLPKYHLIYDTPPTEINTKDKKRLLIDNYVIWKIDDVRLLIQNVRNVPGAEQKIGDAVGSIVRAELGQLNFDEIVTDESSQRGSFNDSVTEKVDTVLHRDNFGIKVIDVRVKRTDLPETNEQSVHNRMISERQSKAQEYLSLGDAEANRIRANTDKVVKEILAQAEAEGKKIQGEGEQEAARIYNQAYAKDPAFYELYRTLQSYKVTLNNEPVIILPINSPYARILMGQY
ncbi:protease modulator HflC [Rubeoparvulum massiliense]|uniref:protease modulator HflC n=1 Tax=Rubeoparvulum massiliense TaxID=1631346 RepID=UPI00065E8B1D|nr:protease modulator HflC [Rubeoparvulum massiliense]